jgi:hypothetical protein
MKLGAWAKHATLALQPGEKRQSSAPKLPPRLSRLAGTPAPPDQSHFQRRLAGRLMICDDGSPVRVIPLTSPEYRGCGRWTKTRKVEANGFPRSVRAAAVDRRQHLFHAREKGKWLFRAQTALRLAPPSEARVTTGRVRRAT